MMNKQEAIKELTNKANGTGWVTYKSACDIINQLDEPEKPVVSQFIADWYEEHKEDLEYNLYRLCINFHERKLYGDLYEWFKFDKNKPIETLILMHQFGYEVKKEKSYRMRHKLTGEYLCFTLNKSFHSDDLNWYTEIKRTQKEWEDMGYWDNNLYEPEEVLND